MNKRAFIVVLLVLVLFSLNFSVAHEIDNSTNELSNFQVDDGVLTSSANQTFLKATSKINTQIDVKSNTTFDVIGDYFKIKLSDDSGNSISNAKVTFNVDGTTYTKTTNNNGIASLQLRINDGSYNIVTKFAGDSKYQSSTLTTTITMNNTRVVDAGLNNLEIQQIIDSAKVNNVILFNGDSYSDINLVITKSLTLLSNVGTTLKSSSTSPVIKIKGQNASLTSIKGFNIQGNGNGIEINNANYVTIYNNDITSKGNGIVGLNTKYLNITKNDILKNTKSGISIAESSYVYIFNNNINNNGLNGIELAKSYNVYIHGNTITKNNNGIYLAKKINGIDYGSAPYQIYINKNTISKNKNDGIQLYYAGNDVSIKSNVIESNEENGISMAHVGSNTLQSNIISDNRIGVKFFDNYVKPFYQDISYNAVVGNNMKDMQAKDTYYQENGVRLDVGDNWYGDLNLMCPKIKSGKIKFAVTQIGENLFQATFTDSNGNIASLLPDRTLTYKSNGKTITMTIVGGAGTFTVDADDGDLVRATVDMSNRDNKYNSNAESATPVNGQTQIFNYPDIPSYQLYGDLGTGNGDGTGQGSGGNNNKGNGNSNVESSDNTGNSTHSQKADPSNSANNQVNDVSQSYDTQTTTSQASASDAGQSNSNAGSQSIVKQINIDEDEFYRVTGISLIVLLMILTIGLYYRDDIKEMNSKR